MKMVSGIGQFHTNEPDQNNPSKKLKKYLTIGLGYIRALVDKPQSVDKAQAQWLIPSSVPSRNFKTQEEQGQFFMLWADLDKNPPTLPDLAVMVEGILGGCDFELYSTRSATVNNQKARLLIPLNKPLNGKDWLLAQGILNDKLQALGIIPDRKNEGAGQLCYLPNKGEFYGSKSKRDNQHFDPLASWSDTIAAKLAAIEISTAKLEASKIAAAERRAAMKLSDSPNLMTAFNQAFTPHDWLVTAGYDQRGDTFKHPNSETGNYSASVRPDASGVLRVNTLSSADPLFVASGGAHDAFSVFCILNHGGNTDAALKDAGDNLLTIACVSYNKAVQIEWAKKKAEQVPNIAPPPPLQQIDYSTMPPEPDQPQEPKKPFSMSAFSLSGQSEIMKTKMLADRFVLDRIAILGQATTIYAKPNTGKTLLVLWMLIESIKAKRVEGKSVFYINADDDFKGLVFKTSLAEQYGFEMLAPGHNGFESAALQGYMAQMIADDTARGTVIILDTLGKFKQTTLKSHRKLRKATADKA